MSEPTGTPPGWYPNPEDPTQQRYWDGATWTPNVAPTASAGPGGAGTTAAAPALATVTTSKPIWKRWWFITATVLIVVGVIAGIAGGGGKTNTNNAASTTAPSTAASSSAPSTAATTAAPSTPAATTAAPVAPAVTTSEASALQSAQSYIDMGSGFSRAGLIDQLDSAAGEGFSKADATWAVDHLKVDWNAQAVLSAKGYMANIGGFSRASLIDQLSSAAGDKYTLAQAVYAAKAVGLG